jgi:hypothetical protein
VGLEAAGGCTAHVPRWQQQQKQAVAVGQHQGRMPHVAPLESCCLRLRLLPQRCHTWRPRAAMQPVHQRVCAMWCACVRGGGAVGGMRGRGWCRRSYACVISRHRCIYVVCASCCWALCISAAVPSGALCQRIVRFVEWERGVLGWLWTMALQLMFDLELLQPGLYWNQRQDACSCRACRCGGRALPHKQDRHCLLVGWSDNQLLLSAALLRARLWCRLNVRARVLW